MKKRLFLILLCALLLWGCAITPKPAPTQAPSALDSLFTVHFIDVGQADSALLAFDGKYILIDGGNVEDSSLVVSYLQRQGVEELEAVICSHAHEDHVGGLPGVLAVFPTKAVYAPTRTYSSNCFDDFLYYTDQQRLEVTIPSPGDTISFGDVTLQVLGPVKSYADTNDTSLVILATYGSTRFLFTGDMEQKAEGDMLDYWGENFDWRADVLKVGHHGSETSTGYRFLREVMPTYGIISVGKGNTYGHPDEAPLSRLEQAGVQIFRTDKLGSIITSSNGTVVTVTWHNTSANPQLPTEGEPDAATFIGNKNSHILHLPGCSSLPKEENQVTFHDYDEAITAGYRPCGKCME